MRLAYLWKPRRAANGRLAFLVWAFVMKNGNVIPLSGFSDKIR